MAKFLSKICWKMLFCSARCLQQLRLRIIEILDLSVTIQLKVTEQYFSVVLFIILYSLICFSGHVPKMDT